MATINASTGADIIVPSNNGDTYRGLAGNDTYILSNAISGSVTIVDTAGANTIQLVDGLSVASSKFAADSAQLTLSNGAVITINGADKFTYEVGGNETTGVTGASNTFAQLASGMGVSALPTGSSISDGTGGTISGTSISSASVGYTLSAGANSVAEGESLTYTVTASSAPSSDVTLSYNVTGDDKGSTVDKAGADDVASLSGTVTLAAGETSVTFTIDADSDTANEGLEGIKVTVFDADLNAIGSHVAVISNVAGTVSNTVAMATTADNIDAGSGDDTISGLLQGDAAAGTTLQPGDVIEGGKGTDTLKVSVAGDSGNNGYSVTAFETSNVEKLMINNFDTDGTGVTTFDLSLAAGLTTVGLNASSATGDTTFDNVQNLVDLEVSSGSGSAVVTYAAAVTAGAADVQNITLKNVTDSSNTMTISTEAVETLNLVSNGAANTVRTLTSTSATSLNISGAGNLTIETAVEGGIAAIDGSAATGNLTLTVGRDASKAGSTVTGSGNDSITYANDKWNALQTLDGGEGSDTIILADADDLTAITGANASSIEVLGASTADTTYYTYTHIPTVTSVASYMGGSNDGTSTIFGSLPADTVLLVAGDGTDAEGAQLNLAQDSSADSLTVTLGATAAGTGLTVEEILGSEYETVSIANAAGSTATIELLDAAQMSSLTLTGAKAISLTFDANSANVSTIDSTGLLALVMGNNSSTIAGGVTITANDYTDTLIGGTQGDTIHGNGGVDTINGAGGADTIHGGAGNDSLEGDGGIDTIHGGAGNDNIRVEVAADFVSLTTAEVVDGGEGTDTLTFGTGSGSVAFTVAATDMHNVKGIEKIAMNDNGNAAITLDNTFFTNGGISSIIVDDTNATGTFGVTGTTLSAGHALDVRASGANVVNTITGGSGNDTATFDTTAATGLKATDTFDGNAGTDTLAVALTANNLTAVTLTLVSDIEHITVSGSGALTAGITLADGNFVTTATAVTVGTIDASGMVGSGAFTFSGASEDDSALVITGGRGGDSLTGGSKADTITGGFGADTITGGPGIDVMTGNAGNDIFSVATAANALGLTSAETYDGGAGSDTLLIDVDAGTTVIAADLANMSSIETINLNGTGADSITLSDSVYTNNGVAALKVFDGQAGDTFTISAGGLSAANSVLAFVASATDATQTITTGAGNDVVYFWNGVTTGTGSGFDDADTINLGAGTDSIAVYLSGNADHSATYTNVSNIEGITYALVSGNSTVTGTLVDGNFVNVTDAAISAASVSGVVTINASAEDDSSFKITGGTGADVLTGADTTTLGDTINGGLGADTIDGSKGGDTLTGGAGADVFDYNAVADSSGSTPDTITDFISGTDSFNVELDYSTNNSGVTVAADVTTAKAGSSAVQESFTGNRGQTVYDTDNSQLVINYNADNLISALDYKINVNAGGTAATTVADSDIVWRITTGSGGDIISTTSAANNVVSSGAGNDSITMAAGDDDVTVTTGTNTIIGNGGGDQIDAGTGITTVRYDDADDGHAAVVLTDISDITDDVTGVTIANNVYADKNDYVEGLTVGTDFVKIGGTLKASLEASGAAVITSGTDLTTVDYNATGIIILDIADNGGSMKLAADGADAWLDISDVSTRFNTEIIAQNAAGGDEILFTIEQSSGDATGLYYLKFGATNDTGQIAATDTIALLAVFAEDDFAVGTVTVT